MVIWDGNNTSTFNQNTESHLQRGVQLLKMWQDGFDWSSTDANSRSVTLRTRQPTEPSMHTQRNMYLCAEWRHCSADHLEYTKFISGQSLGKIITDQHCGMVLRTEI